MTTSKSKKNPKLILGTANYGSKKYGLNKKKFSNSLINKLINFAIRNKIIYFDTANSYNSENKLKKKRIKIFTKLTPIKENLLIKNKKNIRNLIISSVNKSLNELSAKKIFCVMLHRVEDITMFDGYIIKILKQLKKEKTINHIGISIDRFKNLKKIINNKDIRYIQVPINIYDQRWKILFKKEYKKNMKNKIIIARSIYLQGLFAKKNWPKKIQKYKNTILEINNFLIHKLKIKNIDELMFKYVKSLNKVNFILFGASKIKNIKKNNHYLKNVNFLSNEIDFIEKNTKKINKEFFDIIEWNK